MGSDAEVLIVGAGIAGLRCALGCQQKGLDTLIVEATDRIGGRIRTDVVDGFLLDHGFQVLLTAYDECEAVLDYDDLDLATFEPGALIWTGSKFEKLIDPWRRPAQIIQAGLSPIGSFMDKLRVGRLRGRLARAPIDSIYSSAEQSTAEYLTSQQFSESFIKRFFQPFYGGIFLEPNLATTQRMFEFVFKMFGQGFAALPQKGMKAIPEQLHKQLKSGTVQFKQRVSSINSSEIELEDGRILRAREIVLASDMTNASKLTQNHIPDRGWNKTQCSYFTSRKSPLPEPIVALNGSGTGCITNIVVPTDVRAGYGNGNDALICVSTSEPVGADRLKEELQTWFGSEAESFEFIKDYHIPHALPRQLPGDNAFGQASLKTKSGIWLCGDYRYSSSIQGAMASGRLTAKAIIEQY